MKGVDKYAWSCHDCDLLDKSRFKWDDKHYCVLYGCNKTEGGYVCGWCVHDRKDQELKHQGCSYFKHEEHKEPKKPDPVPVPAEAVQLSIFDLIA